MTSFVSFDADQEIRWALESRLAATVLATTGTLVDELASGGTAYTRLTGSFILDGFRIGDAVRGVGFSGSANGMSFVTAVAATTLTVDRTIATVAVGGSRSVVAGLPRVSWPGALFDPPPDEPWVRARVRNAFQATVAVNGSGNVQRHGGIFLVDVFEPYASGMGMARGERLAAAVRQQFRVTTSIVRPSITVRISGLQPGSLLENEDYLQWPVAPEFEADAQLI